MMQKICVFCGSNFGNHPAYAEAAATLGTLLAQRDVTLVYGGGNVGLMGAVADAALAEGGEVIGIMPQALVQKEIAHRGLTKLHIVDSMHERKALMAEVADAFIALPGGYGTFEEFCEVLTWAQLGLHRKPCGVLNVQGYYDNLLALFDRAVEDQFVMEAHRIMVLSDDDPAVLLERLLQYEMPRVEKWISRRQA